MYLKRKIDDYLIKWKQNDERLPLIIKGARQIGKTESINNFAKSNYNNVVYINFVLEPKYKVILGDGYDVESIIKNITLLSPEKKFIAYETLMIFDEIQDYPDIATSLKAFKIDGRFDVICISLYFLGIAVGILMAILLKSSVFKGEAVPFVMELPNYRLPGLKNVVQLLWEKARDFLQRAFTVIFVATIIIWFLQSFDLRLSLTADPQQSILAWLASGIAPLFAPLGFADWRVSTALITGFMAKESVVSTLTILYGSSAAFAAALSPAAAAPLLVFCLLYTPCIAAVASVKRELGGKWAFIMVANQCIVAWLAAFGTRLIMML